MRKDGAVEMRQLDVERNPRAAVDDIVLIGPVGVGKSTVARELGLRLGAPVVHMDEQRERYYSEIGYDPELARRLLETQGPAALWCYWHVFDPHSVERLLEEHPGHVIDMGGGSTIHEHEDQLLRVKQSLARYANVFLLLPHADRDRSLTFLDARTGWSGRERNVNRVILDHKSNYELATFTIFTEERNPSQIASDILSKRVIAPPRAGVSAGTGGPEPDRREPRHPDSLAAARRTSMLDLKQTLEESSSMSGPLGAVAFVALKALATAGAPSAVRERVKSELVEHFGILSDADCNVLSEVAHLRLRDRPKDGRWY